MPEFVHLHVHSQYSILDGGASIQSLVGKAKADGMKAIALTDHGSMFGIKEFYDECRKQKVKPILGCETYVSRRSLNDKTDKEDRSGYHLILLAKNLKGYHNLVKLISYASTEGFYYKPRIDKDLLKKYSEGLIVSSACLGSEIAQKVMSERIADAEEAIRWFMDVFGEDFYLEMQRHPAEDPALRKDVYENQQAVNKTIVELAKKFNVQYVATNDVHFTNEQDAEAHDVLICLNTGKNIDDKDRMHYTKQEWFKTREEMGRLFSDFPEAMETTLEVAAKVEEYELNSKPIMPDFPIPDNFQDQDDYLRHLTYEGAKEKYGDGLSDTIKERIDFELGTIKNMGFPGYFLIVQDLINDAKDKGVIVGPGRGSAAGSVVAYCTGITNIDPIKYDLLFERFLNPDRISMPDIDIDFDDDGRQQVLDYVIENYGKDKVAHICTFGTMAAKMAIRDVARVLQLPLPVADRLAKLIPDRPGTKLDNAFIKFMERVKIEGGYEVSLQKIQSEIDEENRKKDDRNDKKLAQLEIQKILGEELKRTENEKDENSEKIVRTIRHACELEGSVRQTGVHACGMLIGRYSLTEHLPVMPTKGEDLLSTQYDGRFVESLGLLKMDFLGLKTLSIIKTTLDNIKHSKGEEIDIDEIPEDDKLTYELFSKGNTTAIFQFESPGMKKFLRLLKPNRFEDLVAMNALYRPGPMQYIPEYINRKHGKSDILYDHSLMEPFLDETYGITVFQEQVMLQSRALAGFTRGESDSLRKAMGKKKLDLMEQLKIKFINGCQNNSEFIEYCENHNLEPKPLIEKIWKDWAEFAKYAFNKSHSVCYAQIAYQTGYLKAHYPAEFIASVLSNNLNDITKITTFMEEANRMGITVLGPDVNESFADFVVNKEGNIRFGMVGIKGVGKGAVEEIVKERTANGPFKDIYDFVERVNLRIVNKKNMEGLATAGGFDNLGYIERSQYFETDGTQTFTEQLNRYGNLFQSEQSNAQQSLFGGDSEAIEIKKPEAPENKNPWSKRELLSREKSLIGFYISSHPLDDYKFELKYLCKTNLSELQDLNTMKGKEIAVGGMVSNIRRAMTKNNNPFGILTLEDFSGTYEFAFFGKTYLEYSKYFEMGLNLFIRGKVQPRTYKPSELEINITHISLLSDIREQMVKSLVLKLPIDNLNAGLLKELSDNIKENKGDITLYFNVIDRDQNISVNLLSRNYRVQLSKGLTDYLLANDELSFKIQ